MHLKHKGLLCLICAFSASFGCGLYFWLLAYLGHNPFGRWKYIYWGIYGIGFALFFYLLKKNTPQSKTGIQLLWGLLLNAFASLDLFALIYGYLMLFDKAQIILQRYIGEALSVLAHSQSSLLEHNMLDETNLSITKQNIAQMTHFALALDQGLGMLFIGIPLAFFFTLLYRHC